MPRVGCGQTATERRVRGPGLAPSGRDTLPACRDEAFFSWLQARSSRSRPMGGGRDGIFARCRLMLVLAFSHRHLKPTVGMPPRAVEKHWIPWDPGWKEMGCNADPSMARLETQSKLEGPGTPSLSCFQHALPAMHRVGTHLPGNRAGAIRVSCLVPWVGRYRETSSPPSGVTTMDAHLRISGPGQPSMGS